MEATAPDKSGITQIEAIASQQGPVQVVKLEGGQDLKHILIALIAALIVTLPLSAGAIFVSWEASQSIERLDGQAAVDLYFKQRLIQELRMRNIPVPEDVN